MFTYNQGKGWSGSLTNAWVLFDRVAPSSHTPLMLIISFYWLDGKDEMVTREHFEESFFENSPRWHVWLRGGGPQVASFNNPPRCRGLVAQFSKSVTFSHSTNPFADALQCLFCSITILPVRHELPLHKSIVRHYIFQEN